MSCITERELQIMGHRSRETPALSTFGPAASQAVKGWL